MISIIAPVYNTSEYLRQCMDSVLNQTVTDWELIMVDDGSTDGSQDILKEYVGKDSRISFYTSNAGCVSVARNTGIKHAKGDWILFLDSDDYLLPDCLENLLKASNKYPEADMIQASFIVDNQATGKKCVTARGNTRRKFEGKVCDGNTFISDHGWLVGVAWNTLIRSAYLRRHNILFPSDISFQEDLVFIIELARYGGKFVYVDIPTFIYRWGRQNSLTSKTEGDGQFLETRQSQLFHSLINASLYYKSIIKDFDGEARKIIKLYITNNTTGILGSLLHSTPKLRADILKELSAKMRRIPLSSDLKRVPIEILYNISPSFAYLIRRLI